MRECHGYLLRVLCAFVVWSVVAGYNYQLIVIANRMHAPPGPQAQPGLLTTCTIACQAIHPAQVTGAAIPDVPMHNRIK